MIYSCFNSKSGLYDYFADKKQLAINADLPIPRLPSVVQGIGAPSVDAGRPLPAGARFTGSGWLPRGMIVRCSSRAFGDSFSDADNWFTNGGWKWIVGAAAGIWILKQL